MPRNIAGPVVRGDDLWGRVDDIQLLWDQVEKGSVLLAGPRRYGKSSLMYGLMDQPRLGWRVLALHVEYVESPAELLTELTASLMTSGAMGTQEQVKSTPGRLGRWFARVFEGEARVGWPGVGEVKLRLRDGGLPDDWRVLAEEVLARLDAVDSDLLILLDEFPVMIDEFLNQDEAACISFLKWFRAQRHRTTQRRVRWLLGGSVNIEPRLMGLGQSSVINDLLRAHVRPLVESEAVQFVSEVLAGEAADVEAGVAEEIARVCGARVHFFLQVVVEQCLAVARRSGRRLTVEDVEAVYTDRVLGPENRGRFDHYLSRLKTSYGAHESHAKRVLAAVAWADDDGLSINQIEGLFQPEELTSSELEGLLRHLEGDYYIEIDSGHASFASQFLRDWWRRNGPGPV